MAPSDPKVEYDACPRCGRDMVIGAALCPTCEAKAGRKGSDRERDESQFAALKIAGAILAALLLTGCVLGSLFIWLARF